MSASTQNQNYNTITDNFKKTWNRDRFRFKQLQPAETGSESADTSPQNANENENANDGASATSSSGEIDPNAPLDESVYKMCDKPTYAAADWPLVLSATPVEPSLISDPKDTAENSNDDLNAIPKPKTLDSLFTPDIFDMSLKDQLYPDEFYGNKNVIIYE
jgi:hypothetical protein